MKFWLCIAAVYLLMLGVVYKEAVRYTPGIAEWVKTLDGEAR